MTTEIERVAKYNVPVYRMAGWAAFCAVTGVWPGLILCGVVEGVLYVAKR